MDLYRDTSYRVAKLITQQYSTSFSGSIKLFSRDIQPHIYAIYGLTRIADEIVDTYRGNDARQMLEELEREVYQSIERGYSSNPVVAAFAVTAKEFKIDHRLIEPFFFSMAMDIEPAKYTDELYEKYIYGSAEVVGLMCLRVFVGGDDGKYEELRDYAGALGSAYQKINFLRDLAADYKELGRIYFPGISFESFDDAVKDGIVLDIEKDLERADKGLNSLPDSSRRAVRLSIVYYGQLLNKLKMTSAQDIKSRRIRLSALAKLALLISTKIGRQKNA